MLLFCHIFLDVNIFFIFLKMARKVWRNTPVWFGLIAGILIISRRFILHYSRLICINYKYNSTTYNEYFLLNVNLKRKYIIKNQNIYTSSYLMLPSLALVYFFPLAMVKVLLALVGDFFMILLGDAVYSLLCLLVTFFKEAQRNIFSSFLLL